MQHTATFCNTQTKVHGHTVDTHSYTHTYTIRTHTFTKRPIYVKRDTKKIPTEWRRVQSRYAHTHSHTHSYALMHTHIHTHIHTHSYTHTFTYTFIRTHAHTRSHTHSYALMRRCITSIFTQQGTCVICHVDTHSITHTSHTHHTHPYALNIIHIIFILIHPYSHTHDILGCHVSRTLSCVTNSFTLIHTHMTSFLIHPQALILTHSIWTASYSYAFILKSHTHDVLPHSSIRTQSWSHHILTHPSLVTHTWHPSSFIHTHSILIPSCSYASHTHDVLYPHMHMMSSVWHVCA